MTKKYVLLFIFLLFITDIYSNNKDYNFTQLSIEQGLSQTYVNSLLYDSKGGLWISTKSGLNYYNKQQLKTFYNETNNPKSLPDNYVFFTAEDPLNNIWIATGKGLAQYNSHNNTFNLILNEKFYSYLYIDSCIYFGGNKIIYKYNCIDKSFQSIPFPNYGVSNSKLDYVIVKMIQLNNNTILIGTKQKGTYTYNINTKKFNFFASKKGNMLYSLCLKDSVIYEASYGSGFFCYKPNGELIANYNSSNSKLTNNIVLDLLPYNNEIWVATDGGGIMFFNTETKELEGMQHISGDKNSLPVNSITVLYKDVNNNIWAGSVRGGVFGIKETYIKTYKDVGLNNSYGLSEKAIISIYEEDEENVWIGTDGGGINHYNSKTNKFTHFSSTYGDKVVSITGFNNNELLVSLFPKGLYIFNKKTSKYRPFTIINEEVNKDLCLTGYLPMGHKVAKDKIYLLSHSFIIYNPKTNKFSNIKHPKDIYPDAFFLAYSNDSLSYLIRENQIFEVLQKNDSLSLAFTMDEGISIKSLNFDNNQTLWVGTNKGIGYYNIKTKEYTGIETNLFNSVSYTSLDEKGILWVCAQNMLFSYNIKENRFIVWSETDGFTPNEILFMFQKRLNKKNIYLGGTDGFVKINTDISYTEKVCPIVEMSNVTFNGYSVLNEIKDNAITIPWNYNSFKISSGLRETDIFRKVLYRYSIVGEDNKYEIESYNSDLSLPSLQPGKYEILLSCNTKSGNYTPIKKILDLNITPPWYNSLWFISLILLLFIAISAIILFVIIKKKESKLKWEMSEYEQNINKEKINFLINVSHELRTPLTLIYAPLKRLINNRNSYDTQTISKQLNNIYKQARQMKNIINMVLDINRFNQEQSIIKFSTQDFNSWVKVVTDDFTNELEDNNLHLTLNLDNNIGKLSFDEWKCQIVLSNLLINAIKFSPNGAWIKVTTSIIGNKIRTSVSDEGIGLKNVDISNLFSRFYQGEHNIIGSGIGLSYAKQLITAHGGEIGAFNNKLKGATFFFDLPINTEDTSAEQNKISNIEITPQINYAQDNNLTSLDYTQYPSDYFSYYTIVIADDEDDFRIFLNDSLKGYFKQVYTATNGKEAIELCKKFNPDIVISDVMMPNMNGFELCKTMKSSLEISHIPIILLTAMGDKDNTIFGYKQGADFYIPKPFDIDFLLTIINKLIKNKENIHSQLKNIQIIPKPEDITISNSDEIFLRKVNDIINENIGNNKLSINFITDAVSMSRTSLYNKMKALTGMGVNDYINIIRIEKATELLKNSDLNINEISDSLGFSYPRYFSTTFKQIMGRTPSEYKKEHINGEV